jgi:HEAT repeat protein
VPLILCACSSPPRGFGSPDPSARLEAIVHAEETRDRGAIPQLIESLGNDDPVVRLAAINALETITGQTLGYHYWAPDAERRAGAEAWAAWYKEKRGDGTGSKASSDEAGSADSGRSAP